jgi:hypothetical protein
MKPGDFFISLADFFAIVLPGAIFTFILWWLMEWWRPEGLPALSSSAPWWIVFLVTSYVFGHLLHQLGSLLDKVYDKWYIPKLKRKKGKEERLLTLTREVMRGVLGKDAAMTNAWNWATSYTRIHSDAAGRELERVGAESKFFRSLVLVLLFASLALAAREHWLWAGLALVLAGFSCWRFFVRRWSATQLAYEYFILLTRSQASRGSAVPVG